MALAIILAFIVLIAIAVVALFSYATSNRHVEASRAHRVKADLLSQSATAYITGELLGEIKAGSDEDPQDGVNLYFPKTPQDILPARKIAAAISGTDSRFFNLVRQSVSGADGKASDHSTAAAGRNGRMLSPSRWNTPRLLSGNGFTSETQLPLWIYIDRNLGVTNAPGDDVIGRFAYNIYDVSGLLNVNAVGSPSDLTPEEAMRLKATQAGADLSKLVSTLTQTDIEELLTFRHPDQPDASEMAGRALGAHSGGLLTVRNQNKFSGATFLQNMFASRQDLIRYIETKNPSLVDALPYLTHFSRSVNAPSWRPPASPDNDNPDLLAVRFAAGGTVTHFDDAGALSTYEVGQGDPLLQRRFSLAKLSWLTPTGPAPGISDEAIQAVFGLSWDDAEERWDYVGPDGTSPQDSIKTLSEVAAESNPREPNFFELLKAGILTGSVGGTALGKTSSDGKNMSLMGVANLAVDANKDLHILKIGANIIDCADSDNYPTRLGMRFASITIERCGVEDLPYLYSMDLTNLRDAESLGGSQYKLKSSHFVWAPEFFLPHSSVPATSGPSSVQVAIEGIVDHVAHTHGINGLVVNKKPGAEVNFDLSVLPPIEIPSSLWETFRLAPGPLRDSGGSSRIDLHAPGASTTDADVAAFHLYSFPVDPDGVGVNGYPTTLPYTGGIADSMPILSVHDVIIKLTYTTPNNKTKTYATMGGYPELPSTGIDGLTGDDFALPVFKHGALLKDLPIANRINSVCFIAPDPRTNRFGPMLQRYSRLAGEIPVFSRTGSKNMGLPVFFRPLAPFSGGRDFTGNLPQLPAFQDPDTLLRQPDGGIGLTGLGTTSTAANPYGSLGDMTRRPVVLQRPFRNVAELGYVFRDMPWQTLNFYNNESADAALLDLFTVSDEAPITASRVHIATRHEPVVKALLSGAGQTRTGTEPLSDSQIDTVAAAFASTAFAAGEPTANVPANLADLATFLSSSAVSTANLSPIKNRREAVSRALAGGQTRTWNLLLDVFTQAGRFGGDPTNPGNFLVEGENRSWIFVAIDRFTGRIIDLQTERAYE
jgi:hypothetical protein